jgi:hypothetical protein
MTSSISASPGRLWANEANNSESSLPEEGVRQDDVVNTRATWIIEKILVDEEKKRHVYFFAS